MSKKDYVKLAEVIRLSGQYATGNEQAEYVLRLIASGLATVCLDDNPRFNRDGFYDACGVGFNTVKP